MEGPHQPSAGAGLQCTQPAEGGSQVPFTDGGSEVRGEKPEASLRWGRPGEGQSPIRGCAGAALEWWGGGWKSVGPITKERAAGVPPDSGWRQWEREGLPDLLAGGSSSGIVDTASQRGWKKRVRGSCQGASESRWGVLKGLLFYQAV